MEEQDSFERCFRALFTERFPGVFRMLDRLSGDPDLAADLAQETFVKLYRRGSPPDAPGAWLATVALNLFRNSRRTGARRASLLTFDRAAAVHSDPLPPPSARAEADESRARVRRALEALPERERHLLVLRAEGHSYRELAEILGLAEPSVGTLLARARASLAREMSDGA